MRETWLAMAVGGMLVALPTAARGSGTYPGRAPRPPTASVDVDTYHEGKHIFSGEARLGEALPTAASEQAARLQAIQDKLPVQARAGANLPALAGRLSPEQLQALEYYLSVRFKIAVAK